MKKSFRIISALLCVLIISTVLPFTAFAAEGGTYGIFTYEFEYGKLIITGCDVPENGVVVIPEVIGNNFVTRIGSGAFKETNVKNVYISKTVDTIDTEAFYACKSLEKISIPTTVQIVEGSAFWNCSGIENVCYYGSSFSEIESSYKSWTNIQIGDGNEFMVYAARHYHSHENAETETVGYIAPECETEGYSGDKYFKECGVIAEIGTAIEKNGHSSGGWTVVDEPTFDEEGREEERCSVCNALMNERAIPKLIGVFEIEKPSVEKINYGDTLILHINVTNKPETAAVEWSFDGTGVEIEPSEDGMTCAVTSTGSGDVVVKAKLVDENGDDVTDEDGNSIEASRKLVSKAGFFQKLISFFKNLFGSDRIIEK